MTDRDKLRAAAQAVIDRWGTPKWKDAPATAEYIAALRDALAAEQTAAEQEPVTADGWLHENGLLYRLTDERRQTNRDEINVTMADGSRSIEARSRRALELLDRIRATAPRPAVAAGWVRVKDRLPPCRDDQEYIGINTAGFAGVFNAVQVINGNTYCLMETAEESVSIMSDLDVWKPFIRPAPSTEGESNG